MIDSGVVHRGGSTAQTRADFVEEVYKSTC